jgi:hypothetical protein
MALIAPPARDEFLLMSSKPSIGNSKSQHKAKPQSAINTMRHRGCDPEAAIASSSGSRWRVRLGNPGLGWLCFLFGSLSVHGRFREWWIFA